MLKFERTSLEVDLYGTVYNLSRPTVKQQNEYAKSVQDAEESDHTDLLLNLLGSCGLPKEVSAEMEGDHLLAVVNELMPSKKK